MIHSFGNKLTRDLFLGNTSKEVRSFPNELHRAALRKLAMVDYATELDQLKVPPGNRLEALKGNLAEYHSIRINDQWRVIFKWVNDNAEDVQITDYH